MKKIIFILFIAALLSSYPTAGQAYQLRNPQGRLGLTYKTEKYFPLKKSNITATELENIHKIIKDEEHTDKKRLKLLEAKRLNEQKQAFLNAKKSEEAELKQKKSEEKLLLAQQKKQNELKKQQAKNELNIKSQNTIAQKKQESIENEKIKKEKKQQELLAKQQQKQSELENKKLQQKEEKQELLKKKQELIAKEEQKQIEAEKEKKELLIQKKKTVTTREEKLKQQETKTETTVNKNDTKRDFFASKLGVFNKKETNNTEDISNIPDADKKAATKETIKEVIEQEEIKPSVAKKIKPSQDNETIQIVNEINVELANDRKIMLEELSLLWVSAVQKSDTVYFAIMKLSNPNGEDVNKKGIKKILEPIIGAAPLIGQAFVNPAFTAGSLIGSNVMGTMMNDSANTRLAKVNDADLVILARAIDDLQAKLLANYMAYKNTLKEYELAIKISNERKKIYETMNKENSPQLVLAHTFYTSALDNQYKARQEFLMKRVVLEQMVGSEALNEIEQHHEGITNNANQ